MRKAKSRVMTMWAIVRKGRIGKSRSGYPEVFPTRYVAKYYAGFSGVAKVRVTVEEIGAKK